MRFFLPFLLALVFAGCHENKTPTDELVAKPDTLIPRQEMILILVDVHLAEAAMTYMRNHGDETPQLNSEYYNAVFSKYKISKRCFNQNLSFYQADQDDFIALYDEVIKQLDQKKKTSGITTTSEE